MATRKRGSDRQNLMRLLRDDLRAYTGDDRAVPSACHGGNGEFALMAGTPHGPEMVRTTLTNWTRRDPQGAGLLSQIPDREPEAIFR